MKDLRIGDARAPETQIGPAASEAQLVINRSYISRAVADGATLAAGGSEVFSKTPGHYFAPALFTDVSPQTAVARDEIFGPIAAVLRVPDYDAALNHCQRQRIRFVSGHRVRGMLPRSTISRRTPRQA